MEKGGGETEKEKKERKKLITNYKFKVSSSRAESIEEASFSFPGVHS